jgi:putative salt-induced outer membrane protein YdiY
MTRAGFGRLRAGLFGAAALSIAELGYAQSLGAPPPEADKSVKGPNKAAEAPKQETKPDGVTAQVSAGGLSSSGNSKLVAFTGSGVFDWRRGFNGFGASLVGNYGRSAPPDGPMKTTTENAQGRLRYDRYLIEDASLFALVTGRHDKFQGLAFRLNLDPGFKYLFVNRPQTALWAEAGYDLQYDTRTSDARRVLDDTGALIEKLPLHETDHSARLFLGFKHGFNDDVAVATGLEFLQSFVESERRRFNYDLLFTAKVWGDLALGAGFTARFDNAPLPDKVKLDTATVLSLVYSYTNVEKK